MSKKIDPSCCKMTMSELVDDVGVSYWYCQRCAIVVPYDDDFRWYQHLFHDIYDNIMWVVDEIEDASW